jgi:hypothetical protein
MLGFLRRHYLSIDPRTLGLWRVAIALLLLMDLAKRSQIVSTFYINEGLIPNHRVLWRPMREHMLSFLFTFTERGEVQIVFLAIALVYVGLLIGYRTRLMHGLSWLSLVSLQVRTAAISCSATWCCGARFCRSGGASRWIRRCGAAPALRSGCRWMTPRSSRSRCWPRRFSCA